MSRPEPTAAIPPPPWATYIYTPTEKNIFAPSIYKDTLLPMWRFRTPSVATASANDLWNAFLNYEREDDFVGMDNTRKFLQMGMVTEASIANSSDLKTRAKRYANHKGGRKFVAGDSADAEKEGVEERFEGMAARKKKRRKLDGTAESEVWEGKKEKEEASLIFREVWEKARNYEGYERRKEGFLRRQREWRKKGRGGDDGARRARKKERANKDDEDN